MKVFGIILSIPANSRGFTLLELAIVLIILGFVVSAGAGLLTMTMKNMDLAKTRERTAGAKDAVCAYTADTGTIPDNSSFASSVSLPLDAVNKQLRYIYAHELTGSSGLLNPACRLLSTSLTIRRCADSSCNVYSDTNDIAFAVISGGDNRNHQTDVSGGIIRIYPQGAEADDYPADGTMSRDYDDVAEWVNLEELKGGADCSGLRLRILNSELPFASEGREYKASVYADGGLPLDPPNGEDYLWCIEEENLTSPDPDILTFRTSTGTVHVDTDCRNLPGSSWTRGDNVTIGGTPPADTTGTYPVRFWVRDGNDPSGDNDYVANKRIVISIFP
ncbi:type II secretion system protein [Limisalsivibrio acetivorans]|uniref:type II secretion system protein n=1 Tax=Limisalsivibrio acetivorans TaxID=1304888 RepID=UPI0003B5918F|nr:type II secretion system protein [Limisalsivibrio acetivorans]